MSKDSTPLSAYFDLYQLALSYEGKSPKTLATYLANLHQFARHLESKAGRPAVLSDFTPDAVMDYIAARKQEPKYIGHPFSKLSHEPISPFSLDQYVRTLKGFATWLREKRHTRSNVLKDLQRPKLPKLVIEPLTEAEIRRVFATIDTKTVNGARNYAILLLFLDTGLRCGELCGLKLEDVHLEGKHCYVKVMGKGQKERIVYVGRRTHEALLTYRTFVRPRHAKNSAVMSFFLSQEGRTMTLGAVQQMMHDLGAAAGVPRMHPHLLRHTSATQYLVTGGDAISLQHRLGHSGLEMTNRYIHFASAELAAIQERVAPMDKLEIKPMRVPRKK
jgi:site-specific recombinase XerD